LAQQNGLSTQLEGIEKAGGNAGRGVGKYQENIEAALTSLNPFSSQLSQAVELLNSYNVVANEAAKLQKAQKEATEVLTAAEATSFEIESELAAAKQLQATAQAELTILNEAGTATAAELAAAEQLLATATTEVTVAQELATAAALELSTAQGAVALGTDTSTKSLTLFGIVLKGLKLLSFAGIIFLIIGYLKTFDPLVDTTEQAFAGLNSGLNYVLSSIKNVYTGFSNFGTLLRNIGNFFQHPLDSISSYAKGVYQAAAAGKALKETEQDLEDATKANDVASQQRQQKIAALFLAARNRKISAEERKKDLSDATALNDLDFNLANDLANKKYALAQNSAINAGRLDQKQISDLKTRGVQALIDIQNDSKQKGKVTDEEIKNLQDAENLKTSILQRSTQTKERIQNLDDAKDEKAKAAAEARAKQLDASQEKAKKAELERQNAEIATRAFSESARQKEEEAINIDYDKKVFANKKYSATVKQLELERQAALKNLRQKFAIEDAKTSNDYNNLLFKGQEDALKRSIEKLKNIKNGGTVADQQQALDKLQKLHDLQTQQNAVNEAFELQQKDLTEQQKTNIEEKYHQLSLTGEADYEQQRTDLITTLSDKRIAKAKAEKEAIQTFEKEKRDAYTQGSQLLIDIFGKNSAIGKAALLIQKGLAVNEIIINTQRQVKQIQLAEAYQIAAASGAAAATLFGILDLPFVIAGITAISTGKIILAEIEGALQVGSILATAFAKGGIYGKTYQSDGRGGALPGYSTRDNINAHLREGEGIVVSEAMRDPMARKAISDINVAYGGRAFPGVNGTPAYADGGVFSTQFAYPDYYALIQQTAQETAERTAIAVAQNTPRQVLVVQDIDLLQNDNKKVQARQNI